MTEPPTRRPTAAWTPDDVLAAAMDGDRAALDRLVTDARPHVRRFARRLCASEADAADAEQEALVVLFRKVGTLRAGAALAGWMFRVVSRECLRQARSLPAHVSVVGDLVSALAGTSDREPAADDDPEAEALNRLEIRRIAVALAALPDTQRHVVLLRDVRGLPGADVADALGLSLAAMKSHLHRGRAALRARLAA